MRLLLIEDHAPLAANVGDYFMAHDWVVDFAYDGAMGLRLATSGTYDVIVLDLRLPKIDG
ncbi:MAG: response regulator transcription factor, partial [Gammaproteobacteria bacterium]